MCSLARQLVLILCLIVTLSSCRDDQKRHYEYQKTAVSDQGMVVSAHPLATETGIEVLMNGGNAADAAIAVQLTLAVVHPRAGNIGGGGFMLYRSATGEVEALDFREKAPLAAHRDMYLNEDGDIVPGLSTEGHLAAGVPGTIAGLEALHKRFGSMPWEDLFKPAIRIARRGHALSHYEAERLNAVQSILIKLNRDEIPFVRAEPWHEGDIIKHPSLAQTLKRISHDGAKEFYTGKTAEYIIREMQEGAGIITAVDLEKYKPVWRTPLSTDYREYRVISMPPPSSGGIALIQLLEIAEHHPLHEWGSRDFRTIHLMIEAERRVFADRAEYLGDSDFFRVPIDSLLDSVYLLRRMADFDTTKATESMEVQAGKFALNIETFETSHFTVVDGMGNAIAITTTLNLNYGSKVYVDGAGFFLNCEMDDFSVKPGTPNYYGLLGGEANAIASEKRMLSSMTPTIIEKDGKLFMTLGAPGGSTIITSLFQVILNVVDFEMSASQAVAALRFHHQWLPDEIIYETGCFSDSLLNNLSRMGHHLREINTISNVESIHRLPDGTYEGAADPREGSHAEGLE